MAALIVVVWSPCPGSLGQKIRYQLAGAVELDDAPAVDLSSVYLA